jgi:hypothetical protein
MKTSREEFVGADTYGEEAGGRLTARNWIRWLTTSRCIHSEPASV